MAEVKIVYWSGGGNTEAMAKAVAEGVTAAGATPVVTYVGDANVADLAKEKVLALGCPAMGSEVLEEGEMEPFMADLDGCIAGKQVGLFGSYDWGDGQWMRDWVSRIESDNATVVNGEGVIANLTPDDEALENCKKLGEALAKLA